LLAELCQRRQIGPFFAPSTGLRYCDPSTVGEVDRLDPAIEAWQYFPPTVEVRRLMRPSFLSILREFENTRFTLQRIG